MVKILDVIEDKMEFQAKVYIVVITQIENSKAKIEERIIPSRFFSFMMMNITNFNMVRMLVSSIIRANNREPSQSNAHKGK